MRGHPRLVADLSGHGFGHVAMTAPVLNRIGQLRPDLGIVVRSPAPERLLREHIKVPFEWIAAELDFGMAMRDALAIDVDASLRRYRELHRHWKAAVVSAADELAALAPTLLLANVPYLSLAAAERAGIPSVALCCLNWADIFEHYCGSEPEAASIVGDMRAAYASAGMFMVPEPAMPMPGLGNLRSVGPIARRGEDHGAEIRAHLGLDETTILVLLSLGGVPFRIDVSRWPRLEGMHVIAAMEVDGRHPDVTPEPVLGLAHIDLMASSSLVITKPGYGTVTEAAVSGVPVLYVTRDGWPEEPYLVRWLRTHGRCSELPRSDLIEGCLVEAAQRVLALPAPAAPDPTGVESAASLVVERL